MPFDQALHYISTQCLARLSTLVVRGPVAVQL
jgi:hypothetical protein